MNSPFFTVVIPVFNRKTFISEALETVREQSYKNYEIIVVDDGSTDGTCNILKNETNITVIFNIKNYGVSYSRNQGIKAASGKYIAFLDSDDLWEKDKLEKQFKYLEDHSFPELLHCNEKWLRNGKHLNQMARHKKQGGYFIDRMVELCLVSPSAAVIRKDVFNAFGNFDESLPVCEDFDLWLRYNLKFPFHFIEEQLVIKRGGHKNQLSQSVQIMDKYRLQSLRKIILNEKPETHVKKHFLKAIEKKAQILLTGARKRNNSDLITLAKAHLLFITNEGQE